MSPATGERVRPIHGSATRAHRHVPMTMMGKERDLDEANAEKGKCMTIIKTGVQKSVGVGDVGRV